MVWNCTLHVVDDSSLARFAARFLQGLHRDAAFDREYNGGELIANVKRLIAADPITGARALGELALLYVSTCAPHVVCRDFALSLWDAEVMKATVPTEWLGTVESRLPDIIAAYPNIAGRIPTKLDDHFGVGPYVSARHVPALLAHVETALEAMTNNERARYQALCDVLRVAAARGLAYWEGAGIDVAQAHEEWLTPQRPQSLVVAPSPLTSPLAKPLAADPTHILVGEHFVLHELDTLTFPPAVTTHNDMQVTVAAFTPWGSQFVRMATDRTQRPFKFAYYELPDPTPLDLDIPFSVGFAHPATDALLLFPQPNVKDRADARPLVMGKDNRLTPLPLPAPTGAQRLGSGAMTFGDGSLLVIWDGKGYRWNGIDPPILIDDSLGAPDAPLAAATLSDGSIVGSFGQKLVRIDRDGQRDEPLPIGNVTSLALAPDDALIISEGDNPEGDSVKVWWPHTREITHVHPAWFGIDDRPTFVYFDRAAELVVVARPGTWHALPWSELVAMRRVPDDVFVSRRAASAPQ